MIKRPIFFAFLTPRVARKKIIKRFQALGSGMKSTFSKNGTEIGQLEPFLAYFKIFHNLLVHCCIPVSLLIGGWDWVQGGNPLYAAVKCLSDCQGQIWRIFLIFFAKSTCHIHFPGGIFFGGSKTFFYPLKWAIFWGHRHFPRIEGPFPKLRGRAVRGSRIFWFCPSLCKMNYLAPGEGV